MNGERSSDLAVVVIHLFVFKVTFGGSQAAIHVRNRRPAQPWKSLLDVPAHQRGVVEA